MPVPTYDQFIDPLLRVLCAYPQGIRASDAFELAADRKGLSAADRQQILPSGLQHIYKNRIGWAHDRLKRAGYSSSPRKGFWQMTKLEETISVLIEDGMNPEIPAIGFGDGPRLPSQEGITQERCSTPAYRQTHSGPPHSLGNPPVTRVEVCATTKTECHTGTGWKLPKTCREIRWVVK
ncbi:MAG: winged helix-turn-helix domain-containing protein [Acidobacteria bacterium]|nr:winged helix-turn-helix domain-containing protein [Acidobacteriota bacterium]